MKLGFLMGAGIGLLVMMAPPVAVAAEPTMADELAESDKAVSTQESNAEKPSCLQYTGSRIRPPAGQCAPSRGRVYSREDIERTGGVNLNDALRRLDPSLH